MKSLKLKVAPRTQTRRKGSKALRSAGLIPANIYGKSIASQNVEKVEEALIPGYLNPMNSYKYANAVQLLESSKLYDLAYKYAQIGVEFNPDNFDSWKVLYFITNSTAEDKARALENLKRLDPNNPNVLG